MAESLNGRELKALEQCGFSEYALGAGVSHGLIGFFPGCHMSVMEDAADGQVWMTVECFWQERSKWSWRCAKMRSLGRCLGACLSRVAVMAEAASDDDDRAAFLTARNKIRELIRALDGRERDDVEAVRDRMSGYGYAEDEEPNSALCMVRCVDFVLIRIFLLDMDLRKRMGFSLDGLDADWKGEPRDSLADAVADLIEAMAVAVRFGSRLFPEKAVEGLSRGLDDAEEMLAEELIA